MYVCSHRFTGKVPVEEIVKTMKEFVEYVLYPAGIPHYTLTFADYTYMQLRKGAISRS